MEWLAPIPLTPLEDSEWSPPDLNFCQLDRIPDIPKSENNSHLQLDKWIHLDISIGDSVLILHNFTTHQPHPTFPKRSLKYSFGYCRWITNQQKSTENNEIQRFPQLVSNPAGESSRPVTCSRRGAAWASRKPWWIHGFRFMDNRLILCLRTQWIRTGGFGWDLEWWMFFFSLHLWIFIADWKLFSLKLVDDQYHLLNTSTTKLRRWGNSFSKWKIWTRFVEGCWGCWRFWSELELFSTSNHVTREDMVFQGNATQKYQQLQQQLLLAEKQLKDRVGFRCFWVTSKLTSIN